MTLIKKIPSTALLALISIILFIGIPFTKRYIAFTDTFGKYTDVWSVNPLDDPHYYYRFVFVMGAIVFTIISFVLLIRSLVLGEDKRFHFLNVLLVTLIFAIGFKNYPYWVNGIEHAKYVGWEGAYDPKALLPFNIIGEGFTFVILLFYLFCFFVLPVLLLRKIILAIEKKLFYDNNFLLTHAAIIGLICYSFYITPNYFYWIMD